MKVLITGMTANNGGVESYVIELFRNLKNEISFSFLVNTEGRTAYEEEIIKSGCDIIRLPSKRRHPVRHINRYREFFREHRDDYDIVYCNILSLTNIDDILYPFKNGIPVIVHSHNNGDDIGGLFGLRKLLHRIHKSSVRRLGVRKLACSYSAGLWTYGDSNFTVINNSIDTERFGFDHEKRIEIREKLGIADDTIVFGSVGRLEPQKNCIFMSELFSEIHKSIPNSIFLHFGNGSLKELMAKRIAELKIKDSYILMGIRDDVSDFYNAMDYYVFMSRYEGFGISFLESQCNGLVSIISDVIPEESRVNESLIWEYPLGVSAAEVSDDIVKRIETDTYHDRSEGCLKISGSCYDSAVAAKKISEMMKSMGRRR